MMHSLKRRLSAIVVAIFIVSWLVTAVVTMVAARVVLVKEMDRLLSGMLLVTESVGRSFLAGELKQLQALFADSLVPLDASQNMDEGTLEQPVVVRLDERLFPSPLGAPSINIWLSSIHLLVGPETPPFARPPQPYDNAAVIQQIDGEIWRVMYRFDPDNQVWYAAGIAQRQAQLDGSLWILPILLPLMVIIPLTVLALYYGIAGGLRPLRSLARQIERRHQQQSLEAVRQADVPQEVMPVVESLNHLLARLADTLENEQRFTANAAHELQTPLAAITTEVQLCQRLVNDEESRQMMDRIYARVQRASHSVRQLLILARLDPQSSLPLEALNLCILTQDVVSELGHLASEKHLQLGFDVSETASVAANREALLILLRNIVSNAFRYTPEQGVVRISGDADALIFENDSPPIEEPLLLVDRFYRGENTRGRGVEPGTGLGLSIAKRICELHGFRLELSYSQDSQRFVVTIHLKSH